MKHTLWCSLLVAALLTGCGEDSSAGSAGVQESEAVSSPLRNKSQAPSIRADRPDTPPVLTVNVKGFETMLNALLENMDDSEDVSSEILQRIKDLPIDPALVTVATEMKAIAVAIEVNADKIPSTPEIRRVVELGKITEAMIKGLRTLPVKDPWGNFYIYRYNSEKPGESWVASPGKDGKFQGFAPSGDENTENDDIILSGDAFSLGPKIL